jgi:hypothetical protein
LKCFRKLWVKILGTGYFGWADLGCFWAAADVQFFEQVLIDCGAVGWPGEIDMAPDAIASVR